MDRPPVSPSLAPNPFAIEPDPVAPDLPGHVVTRPGLHELIDDIAAEVYAQACLCVRTFGDFHLALSADPLHQRVCMRLMVDPMVRELPWNKTHVWLTSAGPDTTTEEACRVAELLQDHSGIPESQLHPLDLTAAAAGSDLHAAYEERLRESLAWRERGQDRLDFVLLRLAPDGTAVGIDMNGWSGLVSPATVSEAHPVAPGVRMTANMVRAARLVSVVASGAGDRAAVARVAGDSTAAGLRPLAGQLLWFLDDEANPALRTPVGSD